MSQRLPDSSQLRDEAPPSGAMPRLAVLLGLAFVLRLVISLGLHIRTHMVSDHPLFSLATKLRATDALDFHNRAVAIGKQWQDVPFFQMFVHSSQRDHWCMPLAWLYDLFGPRPWAVSIVLCLCYLAMGFLAYSLARAMGQPARRARWLATIISLWPTTLVWSTLPLRDGPFMLAVFMFLASLAWLNAPGRLGPAKTSLCGLGLVLGSGMAYVLKGYMLWAMPAVALCLWAVMLVRNLFAQHKSRLAASVPGTGLGAHCLGATQSCHVPPNARLAGQEAFPSRASAISNPPRASPAT